MKLREEKYNQQPKKSSLFQLKNAYKNCSKNNIKSLKISFLNFFQLTLTLRCGLAWFICILKFPAFWQNLTCHQPSLMQTGFITVYYAFCFARLLLYYHQAPLWYGGIPLQCILAFCFSISHVIFPLVLRSWTWTSIPVLSPAKHHQKYFLAKVSKK